MAKIKHIAIATQDPDKTARFYKEVFDLQEVGKVSGENAEGLLPERRQREHRDPPLQE